MAVNDIYQNTLVASLGTVALANVFYQKITVDAGPPDDQDAMVDAFIQQVLPDILSFQCADLVYECILSRKVSPLTGPAKVYPIQDTGDIVSAPVPANQAITITTRSLPWDNTAGGRYFMAGVPEVWITDGRLLVTETDAFDDFLNKLEGGFTQSGSTYSFQHYSKKFDTYKDILTATLQPIPSRQRNRTQRLCSIS